MSVRLDFFFDLSSPWTRLAFANIGPALDGLDTEIRWRPFLVGGVFNAVNPAVYEARMDPENRKLALSFEWLKEWAQLAGVAMNFPSAHHPLKSVTPMRFCCALEDDQAALHRFADAAFDAYFADERNLDDPAVCMAMADALGMDGAALAEQAQSQPVKDRLRANTDEAIARGAFGSPTIFVGDRFYFGNDQLALVRQQAIALGA